MTLRTILQLALGFAMIAGLLAIHAAALYVIWWLVMLVVRFVPIVGVKHKHRNWDRLNSDDPSRLSRQKDLP